MKNIRSIIQDRREKYCMWAALALCVLIAFSFSACSNSPPEHKQAAQGTEALQGDPIDAPVATSTAQNGKDTQKAEVPSAENLYASTPNTGGVKGAATNNDSAFSRPSPENTKVAMQSEAPQLVVSKKESTAAMPSREKVIANSSSPAAGPANTPPPASDQNSEFQRITLGVLGSFRYEYPDPVYLESEADPSKLRLKDQFPPNIRALHGKKVSIMGYIMPIDVDEQWRVKTFTLVRDQMVCCFGNVPEINEWVYVSLKTPQRADELIDVPVIVFGTLEVGEEINSGALANVYRIAADRVSANY